MIALAHISALPAAIGAVLVLSTVSHGQAEVRRLTTPERTVDHGFTKITEAKELGNRSILILDKHENLVFHVDSAWSQATQVSRHGGGPTEYRIPLGVFVGPDGGALLKDRNGLKFLVLDDA